MMSASLKGLPMVALVVAVNVLTLTSAMSLPTMYASDDAGNINMPAIGGQAGTDNAAAALADAMLNKLEQRTEYSTTGVLKGTFDETPRVIQLQPDGAENGESFGIGNPVLVVEEAQSPGRQHRRLTANINGRGVMPTTSHGSIAGLQKLLQTLTAPASAAAADEDETPVQVFTRSERSRPVRACGGNLLIILENTCMASEEYGIKRSLDGGLNEQAINDLGDEWAAALKPAATKKDEQQTLSLVEACCYRQCSTATLLNYCHHMF